MNQNGGKGAFGQVLFVFDEKNPTLQYAVKVQYLDDGTGQVSKERLKECREEASKMRKLVHKNVVTIHSDYELQLFHFIQMNLCKSSLSAWALQNKNNISDAEFQQFATQILDGVEYIHSKNYVLRDHKLDNILINVDGTIQICDFGGAKYHKDMNQITTTNNIYGTYLYCPPEILKNIRSGSQKSKLKQTASGDIWAFGVCLSVLGGAPINSFFNCHESSFQIPQSPYLTKRANAIIQFILQQNPSQRPNIKQIRNKMNEIFSLNEQQVDVYIQKNKINEQKEIIKHPQAIQEIYLEVQGQEPEPNAAVTVATVRTKKTKRCLKIKQCLWKMKLCILKIQSLLKKRNFGWMKYILYPIFGILISPFAIITLPFWIKTMKHQHSTLVVFTFIFAHMMFFFILSIYDIVYYVKIEESGNYGESYDYDSKVEYQNLAKYPLKSSCRSFDKTNRYLTKSKIICFNQFAVKASKNSILEKAEEVFIYNFERVIVDEKGWRLENDIETGYDKFLNSCINTIQQNVNDDIYLSNISECLGSYYAFELDDEWSFTIYMWKLNSSNVAYVMLGKYVGYKSKYKGEEKDVIIQFFQDFVFNIYSQEQPESIKSYKQILLIQSIIYLIFYLLIIITGLLNFDEENKKFTITLLLAINAVIFMVCEFIGFLKIQINEEQVIEEYYEDRFHPGIFYTCMIHPIYIALLVINKYKKDS